MASDTAQGQIAGPPVEPGLTMKTLQLLPPAVLGPPWWGGGGRPSDPQPGRAQGGRWKGLVKIRDD